MRCWRAALFGALIAGSWQPPADGAEARLLIEQAIQAPDQPVSVQQFQDWRVECATSSAETEKMGKPRCSMVLRELKPGTTEVLFSLEGQFRRRKDDQRIPVFMFQMPLGILLPKGLELKFAGRKAMRLALRSCHPGGCLAPVRLSSRLRRLFQKDHSFTLRFSYVDGSKAKHRLSLMGFTKAYQYLKTQE